MRAVQHLDLIATVLGRRRLDGLHRISERRTVDKGPRVRRNRLLPGEQASKQASSVVVAKINNKHAPQ